MITPVDLSEQLSIKTENPIVQKKEARNYLEGTKILIIEDDCDSRLLLGQVFNTSKANVLMAENGYMGLKMVFDHAPDLVILDIMLPDIDGYTVCAMIREKSSVPIIMLTALDQEIDIIKGLDLGANDYLSKPFSQALLLSRTQAALRSSLHYHIGAGDDIDYSDGYLTISLALRKIWIGGMQIQITPKEFDLLGYLYKNAGRFMSYDQILDHVWGWEYRGNTQYIHLFVSNLRKKIEKDARHPSYLVNEYGVGYAFTSSK